MAQKKTEPSEILVVNDVPGEECRVAIIKDGHLEELYSERTATATNVGNIYLGRVTNVESAIQAAFIDFGEGQNGFLHVSDVHPRHFPGDEQTERVGRKIPRRARPAIQDCLKRGQQILVQVLKEGIGTKGPTLTSYLSIPGRLLVAMPFMDKVGVSRRVEDDDQRREMRKVLDQLELPEGFGFILRTAGLGRTKTDLKRDVAYLMRLWKTMERRQQGEKAPCELYRESDLLIRTIRDVLRPSIDAIIIDSKDGFEQANNFVRVIAPRSAPKVIRYTRSVPIFHAFDIERQIDLIHSREVPLPSGGSIVIEQTEALVAIDVNSGRSLKARDSETNAYETNCEAVDEICRQLRLRDLGGLIINDLIDMRPTRNRRKIEERVRENLKRDRAKSTALRISDFGILEMTRQRMRPSMRKAHFVTCPNCNGHGEIMSAESVATNAVRHAGYLLQYDRIAKLEIVCSPRVASVMLSSKRRQLVQIEDQSGNKIEVRVSDAIATDRVDFYAYDERGADVDLTRLAPLATPTIETLEAEQPPHTYEPQEIDELEIDGEADEVETPAPSTRKKRWRRRSKARDGESESTPAPAEIAADAAEDASDSATADAGADGGDATDHTEDSPVRKKRRRRGRRGGRRRSKAKADAIATEGETESEGELPVAGDTSEPGDISSDAPPAADAQQSMRVHALAKELGIASKAVIERAEDDDSITIKNHMSTVTPDEVHVIRNWFNDSVTENAAINEEVVDEQITKPQEPAKPGRRRRRSRRGARKEAAATSNTDTSSKDTADTNSSVPKPASKSRGRKSDSPAGEGSSAPSSGADDSSKSEQTAPAAKKSSKRRRKKKSDLAKADASVPAAPAALAAGNNVAKDRETADAAKRRRSVYASRRRVSPEARALAEQQES